MVKFLLPAILALIFFVESYATHVDISTAEQVAVNFYTHQYFCWQKSDRTGEVISFHRIGSSAEGLIYVFNMREGGFVLVSGDDHSFPVIGYDFEGSFDPGKISPGLSAWLANAQTEIRESASLRLDGYKSVWDKLLAEQVLTKDAQPNVRTVNALVTTRWDQDWPYNMYCPPHSGGPGGHCLTGCVATAMAQVMNYHEYPDHGKGMMTFTWADEDTIDFENTYYRWDEMTTTANSLSMDAIGELMYHCGVAVYMNYGASASGSFTEWVPEALKNRFRYRISIRYIDRGAVSDTTFDLIIRDNLDLGLPLVYSGSGSSGGHAFVCDGYQDTCYYHFNWGWGGSGNGYYYYNDLSPGGSDFTLDQGIVYNIAPYDAPYCKEGKEMTEQFRNFGDGSDLSFYWKNTSCSWLIQPPGASKITLSFSSFQTEWGKDILRIYDGPDSTAELIGEYSGSAIPPELHSTGGALYITFSSDSANQFLGWEAGYYSNLVSVPEIGTGLNAILFPNPADQFIIVQLNEYTESLRVELINIVGSCCHASEQIIQADGQVKIPIDVLEPGLYLVRLSSGTKMSCWKVLVE